MIPKMLYKLNKLMYKLYTGITSSTTEMQSPQQLFKNENNTAHQQWLTAIFVALLLNTW